MPRAPAPPRQSHTNHPYTIGAGARGMDQTTGRVESSGGNEARGSAGSARTRDGCLMCRWRKKGCTDPIDEYGNVPSGCCGTCNDLKIPCLGYEDPESWGQRRTVIMRSLRAVVLVFLDAMYLKRPSYRYSPVTDQPGFTGMVEELALHELFRALGRLEFKSYFGPSLEALRSVETPAVSPVAHNSPLHMSSIPASPSELLALLNHPAFSMPPIPTLDAINNIEHPNDGPYWSLLHASPIDATIPLAPSIPAAPRVTHSSDETLTGQEGASEPEDATTDPDFGLDQYFEF